MSRPYPPGVTIRFALRHARTFLTDPLRFLELCAQEYGDFVAAGVGPRIILLNHPDYIREVLVGQDHKLHRGRRWKHSAGEVLGNGLVVAEGAFHARQRRLMQPALHASHIDSYADVMVQSTRRLLERWGDGAVITIDQDLMRLTLDIVTGALFSSDVSHQAEAIRTAISASMRYVWKQTRSLLLLPGWLPTPTNRAHRRARKVLDAIITDMIDERRARGEDRGDLISMLLLAEDHDGSRMTDRQVRDEVMTLFIAGHETTYGALTWAFYLLSQHPEAEARLIDEIESALGGRPPTCADLPHLPYTERVIKEALRLYPPVWVGNRYVVEDVVIGGYTIPKGYVIFFSPYLMHRDARYFPDPARFDPERFSPEREAAIPRYAYFPFGGGPRVCLGNAFAMMEARLVLATIMQRFHLTLVPGQKIETEPMVTLRARCGVRMRAHARGPAVSASHEASLAGGHAHQE